MISDRVDEHLAVLARDLHHFPCVDHRVLSGERLLCRGREVFLLVDRFLGPLTLAGLTSVVEPECRANDRDTLLSGGHCLFGVRPSICVSLANLLGLLSGYHSKTMIDFRPLPSDIDHLALDFAMRTLWTEEVHRTPELLVHLNYRRGFSCRLGSGSRLGLKIHPAAIAIGTFIRSLLSAPGTEHQSE